MPKLWRVIDLLNWAESYFKEKGFENPRGEIEWLLRAVLDCSRMDVYLRFEEPLSQSQLATLRGWVKRRLAREPLQYITGFCDFYGREFFVNKHVLIPRPETERLIDTVLENLKGIDSSSILDVGTGSGCIATTLGLEIPSSTILGVDVSSDVLQVANENKENLGAENVSFEEINILKDIGIKYVFIEDDSLLAKKKRAITIFYKLIKKLRPKIVLVQGDTTTAAGCAYAASLSGSLVAHNEAGLRTFDNKNPYPEELNRKLISFSGLCQFSVEKV